MYDTERLSGPRKWSRHVEVLLPRPQYDSAIGPLSCIFAGTARAETVTIEDVMVFYTRILGRGGV